jgi:anaerobic selenocysteine-containing dehydrogenase
VAESPRHPDAQPPVREPRPVVAPYDGPAAGLGAVKAIAVLGTKELGPVTSLRALNRLNQRHGFDCPGCAWPDPQERTRFEYCENGAKAVFEEATRKRVDAAFFARHGVAELATWSDHELGKAGRLCEPMILEPGATHYRPISWDQAFARIAGALKALPTPNDAIFYTSGRTSNAGSAPTTCRTAATCATSRPGSRSPSRSGRARAR